MFQKSFLKNCLELLCLQDRDKKKELIQGHVAWLKQVTLALCGSSRIYLRYELYCALLFVLLQVLESLSSHFDLFPLYICHIVCRPISLREWIQILVPCCTNVSGMTFRVVPIPVLKMPLIWPKMLDQVSQLYESAH